MTEQRMQRGREKEEMGETGGDGGDGGDGETREEGRTEERDIKYILLTMFQIHF